MCTYFSHLSNTGKGLEAHDHSNSGVRTAVDIRKLYTTIYFYYRSLFKIYHYSPLLYARKTS